MAASVLRSYVRKWQARAQAYVHTYVLMYFPRRFGSGAEPHFVPGRSVPAEPPAGHNTRRGRIDEVMPVT
jgi:hypothetical protein